MLIAENHNYLCHIDYNTADTGHGRSQRPGRYGTHCPGSHNSVVYLGNLKGLNFPKDNNKMNIVSAYYLHLIKYKLSRLKITSYLVNMFSM